MDRSRSVRARNLRIRVNHRCLTFFSVAKKKPLLVACYQISCILFSIRLIKMMKEQKVKMKELKTHNYFT